MLIFALKTLLADRGKLLTGLAGVIFSLVLVNVQGGLFLGLMHKASVLIDHCEADLWIGHKGIENVDFADDIPELWINRVRGIEGIERVEPYIVGKGLATLLDGGFEDVWIIGSEPASMMGTAWSFTAGSCEDLKRPDAVSFDDVDAPKLGNPRVGDWLEVNAHHARFVARTRGITGFMTTPYLFATLETARRLSNMRAGYCSYFLVKAHSGADIGRLRREIVSQLPDVGVHTPSEFARISRNYWIRRTGIGVSFGAATALGLLVGLMMVAQSLYALALDHIGDFATLKALGAEDRQVCRIIIQQSVAIAAVGSAAGLAIVLTIRQCWSSPLAPIDIPPALASASVVFVFAICLAASLLPYLRIRSVDPAIVLQG